MSDKRTTDAKIKTVIQNWGNLAGGINDFSETDLQRAMDIESKGKKRFSILLRLHQRFTKVRAERERKALFNH